MAWGGGRGIRGEEGFWGAKVVFRGGGSYGFQENERGTGSDGLLKGDQSLLMELSIKEELYEIDCKRVEIIRILQAPLSLLPSFLPSDK